MSRFKKVYIEITNTCNLTCDFCPKTKRQSDFLNKESFSHIINEVKPYTNYVYLHLMGEPLLHPNLSDFLSICYENNLKAIITTNGTLIEKTKGILLNASALHKINISLHSFDANKINLSLTDYLSEILSFSDIARKNTICVLRLWNIDSLNTKENSNNNIINTIKDFYNLDFDIIKSLDNSKSVKLKPNLYIEKDNRFDWPDIEKPVIGNSAFCYGLRDQIGILTDGTVVPCCLDKDGDIALGNIFNTPLSLILNAQQAKDIYDGFSKRKAKEELCKRCGYAHSRF